MERSDKQNYVSFKKILIFGDKKAGKKTFLNRIKKIDLDWEYRNSSTNAETDLTNVKISIDIENNNAGFFGIIRNVGNLKLDANFYQIDTDDKYESIYEALLYNTKCILLFFDITNQVSFNSIKNVLNKIKSREKGKPLQKLLVCTKCDLESTREVSKEEIQKFCEENALPLFSISSYERDGLDGLIAAFSKINYKQDVSSARKISVYESDRMSKNNSLSVTTVYKIILLGDGEVGKSSFFKRYFYDDFENNYLMTMGVNDNYKYIKINGNEIKMQVWDTAGQERFRSLPRKYYQHADGIILMYDVTNRRSFNNVTKWLDDITDNTKQKLIIYLIGNKIDLMDQRQVEFYEAVNTFTKYTKIKLIEISCKLDINVTDTLMNISQDIFENYSQRRRNNCSLLDSRDNKGKSCCASS